MKNLEIDDLKNIIMKTSLKNTTYMLILLKMQGITGTKRVPDPDDCTHFYLCDGGASMRMPCRSAEPHFNRCTEKCEVDMDVCNLRTCDTVKDFSIWNFLYGIII